MNKVEIYKNFFTRQLKNILRVRREWTGFPDTVDTQLLNENLLFNDGFSVVYEYKGDIITTTGALAGLNREFRPTSFTSANPYVLPAQERTPGKDCVIIYNTPRYQFPETFSDIVEFYSMRMAEIAISMDTSIKNSRVCIIPIVRDEKEANRTAKILNDMYEGKPCALSYASAFSSDNRDILFPIKARDNIVTSELQDALNQEWNSFYQTIGVINTAVDKKERTNLTEMTSNLEQLELNKSIWTGPHMERSIEELKEVFGLNIELNLRGEEVEEYATSWTQTGTDTGTEAQSEVRNGQDSE